MVLTTCAGGTPSRAATSSALCAPGVGTCSAGGQTAVAARPSEHLGPLHIGGIIAVMAEGNGVFARIRQDHKLVRKIAANGAGIGLHRAKRRPRRWNRRV